MVRRVIALFTNLDGFEESPVRAEDVVTAGLSALAGLELLTVGEEISGLGALLVVLEEVKEAVGSQSGVDSGGAGDSSV